MPRNSATSPEDDAVFSPSAAFLAWLWPGLGHISLGQRRRGVYIMLGVLFLVACGLLVGGVDAVDRREDRLWFYAQAVCGPIAFAADTVNQRYLKTRPYRQQLELKGLGKVNELGTLFIALAGLMNLIVILDALHYRPLPTSAAAPAAAPRPPEAAPRADAPGPEGTAT